MVIAGEGGKQRFAKSAQDRESYRRLLRNPKACVFLGCVARGVRSQDRQTTRGKQVNLTQIIVPKKKK